MMAWLLLWLLQMTIRGCLWSDGSPSAPFFVDPSSIITSATGSSCAPYFSLETALIAGQALASVTISLGGPSSLPAWTLANSVVFLGNSNEIDVTGTVAVTGTVEFVTATLVSSLLVDAVFRVTGSLSLSSCVLSHFSSLPILVEGQVVLTSSTLSHNSKGVVASLVLKGTLTATDSHFLYNANTAGAVFFIYPSGGSGLVQYTISNCKFQGNGSKAASSVLLLNDLGVISSAALQRIAFTGCRFEGHPAATFQIISRTFSLEVQDSSFEGENRILSGSLSMVNVTIARVTVVNCAGPLFSLSMSGLFLLSNSTFTSINPGPVVYVTGRGSSVSLVRLASLQVRNIQNLGNTVYGNLINSLSVTLWITDVYMSNFEGLISGIFALAQTVLYSSNTTFVNGTAPQYGIGQLTACTTVMNSTVFELVNSRGAMFIITASNTAFYQITYRNIQGFWDPTIMAYTTNCLLFAPQTVAIIDGLVAELVRIGSPILYVYGSKCTISNSKFTGPLGMGLFTVFGGSAVMRTSVYAFTEGRSIAKLLLGGYLEFDVLSLENLALSGPLITISSQSTAYIRSLLLRNVTTMAFSKGQDYKLVIDSAHITRSNVAALVHFSIGV